MRSKPALRVGAMEYYRTRSTEFICHWVDTYDPRHAGSGIPAFMPFILFTRQADLIDFLDAMIDGQQDGLVEKCRDMGATWLCAAFSVHMWRFRDGASIGWGSRKEDLVDRIGDPKSIFEKIRMIIERLPPEFLPPGYIHKKHATHMKIINPDNGSTITGEAGDNIGRGGRSLIYFKDEAAHYERPERIEAALGDNTRVQIDISSVNGLGNVFHRRREAGVEWNGGEAVKGKANVFVMDWSDHPEKDQDWYDRRKAKAEEEGLLHNFAQEIDRDYSAAVQGTVIKAEWVKAAIDAHKVLGLEITGGRTAGLDVADEGLDRNAWVRRRGILLEEADDWASRDTGVSARKTVELAEKWPGIEVQYDCIGIGASVKSEINRLIDEGLFPDGVTFVPWSAAAAPLWPEEPVNPNDEDSPLNKDFFDNIKAQGWFLLARRFFRTWQMVKGIAKYPADDLISLSGELKKLRQIEKELCQPTMSKSSRTMKMVVNKTPEGTASPNIGDAIMQAYHPVPSEKYVLDFL